jgi:hypothetical protein
LREAAVLVTVTDWVCRRNRSLGSVRFEHEDEHEDEHELERERKLVKMLLGSCQEGSVIVQHLLRMFRGIDLRVGLENDPALVNQVRDPLGKRQQGPGCPDGLRHIVVFVGEQ